MNDNSDGRVRRFGRGVGLASVALLWLAVPGAQATDPAGLYVGGAFGQARVNASNPFWGPFSGNHSAFKIIAGLRPIPVFGAELAYADFGHPDRGLDGCFPSDVTMKGAAAFGMFYFPVPVVDVYVKGGLARLQSTRFLRGARRVRALQRGRP
jgi:hypothetical protein